MSPHMFVALVTIGHTVHDIDALTRTTQPIHQKSVLRNPR